MWKLFLHLCPIQGCAPQTHSPDNVAYMAKLNQTWSDYLWQLILFSRIPCCSHVTSFMSCGKLGNCDQAFAHTRTSAKLLHKWRSISPPCVRLNWYTMFPIRHLSASPAGAECVDSYTQLYCAVCMISIIVAMRWAERTAPSFSTFWGFLYFQELCRCSAVELAPQESAPSLKSVLLHVWVCLCRSNIAFQAMENGNNLKFQIRWKCIFVFRSF